MGECGLPPKKEHCYFSDYNDVKDYFLIFINNLNLVIDKDPFG